MRSSRQVVSFVVVCASVALSSAPASAEWFADLFLGGAFTENSNPTAQTTVGGVPTSIATTTFPRSADPITHAPTSAIGSNSLSTHQVVAGVTVRF